MALLLLILLVLLSPELSQQQHSISWMETAEKDGGSCSSRPVSIGDNVTLHNRISIGPQEVNRFIINYVVDNLDYSYEINYLVTCKSDKNEGITLFCPRNENIYDHTINLTAHKSLSEATVKATLHASGRVISSTDEIKLPAVYDTSQIDIEVFINDNSLSTSQCIMTVNGKSAVVWLKPVENIHMTYLFTVNENRTGKLLKNDADILTYSIEEIGENLLLLSYEIESIPGSKRNFTCSIRTNDVCIDDQTRLYVFIGLFTSLICAIFIMMCFKAKYVLVCGKQKNLEGKMEESEFVQDEKKTSAIEVCNTVEDKKSKVHSKEVGQDTYGQLLPTDIVSLILEKKPRFVNNTTQIMENFPKRYSQIIQFQFNNMVKIEINKTSNRRPKHWPGETFPYPYYSSGGCDTERLGVGRIVDVKLINKDNRETSLVWKSQYPRFDKTEWIEVTVYTSRHVVFDDIEAKHTTCSLLLNDFDGNYIDTHLSTSPLNNYTGDSSIRFKGELVNMANIDENWIFFTCTSEDLFCINDLKNNLSDFNRKWRKIMLNNLLYKDVQNKYILVELHNKDRKQIKDDLIQMKDYLEQTKDYLEHTNECLKKIKDNLKPSEDQLEKRNYYLYHLKDYLKLKQKQLKPTEDHLEHSEKYFKQTKNQLKESEDHLIHANDYLNETKDYLKQYKDYLKRTEDHLKKMEKEKTRNFLEQMKDFSKTTEYYLEQTKIYLEHTEIFF